jgi:Skp family chaperone for outer membrane proteins
MRHWLIALALGLALPVSVSAQETTRAPSSPVLLMDSAAVLNATNLGRSISAEIETAFTDLASENRRIEAELEVEEKQLTEQRPELSNEDFRALADAFDEKVQRIRAEQEAKRSALEQRRDAEQQDFFTQIAPILSAIGNRFGAVVILERRNNVILAADGIDITQQVIEAINASAEQPSESATSE